MVRTTLLIPFPAVYKSFDLALIETVHLPAGILFEPEVSDPTSAVDEQLHHDSSASRWNPNAGVISNAPMEGLSPLSNTSWLGTKSVPGIDVQLSRGGLGERRSRRC